jgi:hypothetical protein
MDPFCGRGKGTMSCSERGKLTPRVSSADIWSATGLTAPLLRNSNRSIDAFEVLG